LLKKLFMKLTNHTGTGEAERKLLGKKVGVLLSHLSEGCKIFLFQQETRSMMKGQGRRPEKGPLPKEDIAGSQHKSAQWT